MYGFEFNIAGNAQKALGDMFQTVNDVRTSAKAMQSQFDAVKLPPLSLPPKNPFRDVLPSVTAAQSAAQSVQSTPSVKTANEKSGHAEIDKTVQDTQKPVTDLKERLGGVLTAALDIKKAYDLGKESLTEIPQRWESVKGSIVDTWVAFKLGDNWTDIFKKAMPAIDDVLTSINDVRTTWGLAKQGFQNGFPNTFEKISNVVTSLTGNIKTMGLNIVTSVGRGVVSVLSYMASLIGATGAQTALNVAMAANPIGLIVLGVVAIGGAIYGLIKYWEDVKGWLIDFGKFFWRMSPFSWLVDITDKLFPGFKKNFYDTFGKMFDWVYNHFIKPIKASIDWLKSLFGEISNDVNTTLNDPKGGNNPEIKKMFESYGKPFNIFPQIGIAPTVGASAIENMNKINAVIPKVKQPKTDLGIDRKSREIAGQERNVRINNIQIGSIGQGFTVVTEKAEMSEEQLKRMFTRWLVDITNQTNYQ